MFKLNTSQHYQYPVTIEMIGENGSTEKFSFTAHFKRLKQSDIDTLLKKSRDGEQDDNELIASVLIGWDGVQDETGADLAYNTVNRDALLDVYPVRPSVVQAWIDSLSGAKRKN